MDTTLQEIEKFLTAQGIQTDTQQFISIVSNYFHDEESKSYDNHHDEIFSAELIRCLNDVFVLLKNSSAGRKLKVLDVGAGTGFLSNLIYENIEIQELHCLEPSFKMLEVLKEKMKGKENIICHNCNIEELEIFDFDLIVSNSVLHHIPNVSGFLNSIESRLKPEGFYLISHEPNFEFYSNKKMVGINQRIRFVERIINRIKRLAPWNRAKNASSNESIETTVNDLLIQHGLVPQPLHPYAIRKLIDIHIPIVNSTFRWGYEGFNSSSIVKILTRYKEVYSYSYEPIRSRYSVLRIIGKFLLTPKSTKIGHNFVLVIQKPDIL